MNIENKKEEKKKRNPTVKYILIVLFLVTLFFFMYLRADILFSDMGSMTITEKVGYIIAAVALVGSFFVFAMLPKNFRRKTSIWVSNIWAHLIIPGLIGTIILLGALHTLYPNPPTQFEQNVTDAMKISSGAVTGAFTKIVMTLYNMGAERPILWLYVMGMFIVVSIYFIFGWVKDEVEEENALDEAREQLKKAEEDYLKKKKEEQKLKPIDITFRWIFFIIIVLVLSMGVYLYIVKA
jgi:hypothetical protein